MYFKTIRGIFLLGFIVTFSCAFAQAEEGTEFTLDDVTGSVLAVEEEPDRVPVKTADTKADQATAKPPPLPDKCLSFVPVPDTIDTCIDRIDKESRRNLTRISAALANCQDEVSAQKQLLAADENMAPTCSQQDEATRVCPEGEPAICPEIITSETPERITALTADLGAAKKAFDEEIARGDTLSTQASELTNQLRGANLRLQAAQDRTTTLEAEVASLREEKLTNSLGAVLTQLSCVPPDAMADLENGVALHIVTISRDDAQASLAIIEELGLATRIAISFADLPEGTDCPIAVDETYAVGRWSDEAENILYSFFQAQSAQERIDRIPSAEDCNNLSFTLGGAGDPVWVRSGQALQLCDTTTGQVSAGRIRRGDSAILMVGTQQVTP